MTRINMDCFIHATRLLVRDAAVRSPALQLAALILLTPVLQSDINASFWGLTLVPVQWCECCKIAPVPV